MKTKSLTFYICAGIKSGVSTLHIQIEPQRHNENYYFSFIYDNPSYQSQLWIGINAGLWNKSTSTKAKKVCKAIFMPKTII